MHTRSSYLVCLFVVCLWCRSVPVQGSAVQRWLRFSGLVSVWQTEERWGWEVAFLSMTVHLPLWAPSSSCEVIKKNTSCLVLKDASSETAVCAMINASVGVINISRQLVLTPRTTSEQVDRKMSGCEYNSNNTNLLMYLVFLAEQDRRIFDYNRSVMLFYPHSSPRRLLEVM